jgi:hypothetical protein
MKGLVNDLLDQNLGRLGPFAAAWSILFNPSNATLRKTASPQADRLGATAKLSSDFLVEHSRRGQERDLGPQHQTRRRRTAARPAF